MMSRLNLIAVVCVGFAVLTAVVGLPIRSNDHNPGREDQFVMSGDTSAPGGEDLKRLRRQDDDDEEGELDPEAISEKRKKEKEEILDQLFPWWREQKAQFDAGLLQYGVRPTVHY
ncbi:uncharacterized protein LOC111058023 [Nilaparvata lugens]|uniref:uncharacterized protein LOC111058023 n=1 Tax=Nilaparvata lugens TaxID=108931 RepID=UPI00193E4B9C|nr:uncharacterized protein LOC111058023 [Nilaparvata lugens]